MLEWKRVQLIITNYIVMNEEFIFQKKKKMLDVCVPENRSLPEARRLISITQRAYLLKSDVTLTRKLNAV